MLKIIKYLLRALVRQQNKQPLPTKKRELQPNPIKQNSNRKMKTKLMLAAAMVIALASLSTQAQQVQKIGWTDVDYILNVLPDSKRISNELQIQQQQIQKALEEKQKDLQEKYAAYQKNASTWSEIIRADKEKQIQSGQTDLQEFQQSSQETLQKKYQVLINPVMGKIDEAVKIVGKENGFTLILNRDAGANTTPVVLYSGSDDINVTNLVLKKMGVDPAVIEKQALEAAEKAAAKAAQPAAKPALPPIIAPSTAPSTKGFAALPNILPVSLAPSPKPT
ncbi:MAG: OmpH family outer membrane protein [Runella slithyformis]|nr:MAG: OmpH family outer membrane protein [Runella slithyformis]